MKASCKLTLMLVASLALSACATTPSSSRDDNQFVPVVRVSNQTPPVKKEVARSSMASHKLAPPVGKPLTLQENATKVTTGVAAITAANKKSLQQPNSGDYVNAIMYFTYASGILYQIYSAPLHITDIEFQAGEKIISVAGGDTSRWSISKTSSGEGDQQRQHLLIKPEADKISNVVVVTTDKRTYHLLLKSSTKTYMPIVAWNYPNDGVLIDDSQQVAAAQNKKRLAKQMRLNQLNFNYTVKLVRGDRIPTWMPTMVFSDGQKTYIQFAKQITNAPSLFMGSGENNQIVNYRINGDYYIVDAVLQTAQLRLGAKNPTIVQISRQG